ncbi:hypothetical protein BBB39_13015 [Bordetella trematum]|uniref:KilA-N domain-containing protein n=1 Tax=Bordetella trematum TaxID=123899 RepID=UPI0007B550F4|nr:KilA-N domain-containing protein [Bordetella trematum]AZR96178.1 hypothetical protein BBB39_13015 [Bordetella trematum]NNH19133.1 KilA-N domain-containing protein [Bordetella trematum]
MKSLTICDTSIGRDDGGRYSLNDLHRASGGAKKHQPAMFMRLGSTKNLIAEIQSTDMQSAFRTVNGGPMRGTYVCKELVYAYAMWINSAFALKVIRAYDAMQTTAHGLWKEMQALIAEEVSTQVRASFGSRLMLERKRAMPDFRRRREQLEARIQPSLIH